MNKIDIEELVSFANENIDKFHASKIAILQDLSLKNVLQKKNPYLFKAKNLSSASDLITDVMNAFLYASEEKLFGDFLESLAIFISSESCGGEKSSAEGIDLEFKDNDIYYLVSIKSGKNWGNSSQQKKQQKDFERAVAVKRQLNRSLNIQPVLGICYGKTRTTFLRGYMKVVGQSFWHLISGDENLFTEIIEPLGYKAREHNEKFMLEKSRVINLFTKKFIDEFCDDGVINWKRLVQFNSGNLNLQPIASSG